MAINVPQVEQYIRQAAQKRGIDPDIAVRAARSEGLAPGVWQSNVVKDGKREPSYGPFQMLVGGPGTGFPTGLGNAFMQETGIDPRDPANVYPTIDYALDTVAKEGWAQWYGPKHAGIGRWDGVKGAKPAGIQAKPSLPPEAQSFVDNNPQPGGYGPGISDPNSPQPSPDQTMMASTFAGMPVGQTFGGMAPSAPPSPVPTSIASYATSDKPKSFGDRLGDMSKAWDAQMPQAPRLGPMQGPGKTGNALTEFLNSPTATDLLMKKRMSGVA